MAALRDVRAMDVVLTAGCNLRCVYCYQNAKQERRMEWASLRQAIDTLLQSGHDEVNLSFYGGEPLLQFDLIRKAVAHVASRRRRRPRVGYSMITNGTLLRGEVADFVAQHGFATQISFDGVAAAQDLRGRGTFPVLDAVLTDLRRRHGRFLRDKVSVSLTLMGTTIRHLARSFAYLLRKGVQEITVSPLVTHDASWSEASMHELDREFERVFRRSVRHFRRTGEVPLVLLRRNQAAADVHAPRGTSMCGVGGGESLTVDVDGQVHGCVMFAESYQRFASDFLRLRLESMRLGPLGDPGLPARLAAYPAATEATALFDAKQDKYSSYGRCGECRYLETCTVCPVSIGNIPGNADPRRVPDHLCAFNLVTRKWRDRFPVQPSAADVLLGNAPLPRLMRELRAAVEGGR